ncbi:hypothetical protein F4818DRAFT_209261 [Hypoxylon cercidicola]|nr:hypothetical protein F4818DRAFT_209261 [Hypoxylon cercidicola]
MGKFGIGKALTPYPSLDSEPFEKPNSPSSSKRGSIRQRFMRGLSHKKSIPAWQPAQDAKENDGARKENMSFIRKSIGSISSSLRGRRSSEHSIGGEGRRPSVIRRSFGSVSSSLRGIRSSISSQRSQDTEERAAPVRYHTLSGALGRVHSRKYNSFGLLSCDSPKHDSVPKLPALEEMIANARAEKTTLRVQSPNSLLGMFDALDGPFDKNWHGALSIRLKYPGRLPLSSDTDTEAEAVAAIRSRVASAPGCCSNASDQTTITPRKPPTSKVPAQWLDHILETSAATRDGVVQTISPPQRPEANEWNPRVTVNVPDNTDHSKPWPKRTYPDLKSALHHVCTRLKPFYAPFAAYTDRTHALQLFPSEFSSQYITDNIPHTIFFDMQEILDEWNTLPDPNAPPYDEENFEASSPTELTSDSDSGGS